MAENCDPHSEMCGKSQRAPERKLLPFRCSACLWDLSNPRYGVAHFLRGLLLHLPCGVGAAGDPASQENFNCISGESSHANSTNFDCFRYYIRSCKQKVGGRGKRKSPLLKSGDFLHCLDKGNPRLCRGRKRAYSEGRSRQEKVSKLE